MGIDALFEKSCNLDAELLNLFFEKIKDRIPKYIVCENSSHVESALAQVNLSVEKMQEKMMQVSGVKFKDAFTSCIDEIANHLNISIEPPARLHDLTPTWHELIDIKYNYQKILSEVGDFIEKPHKPSPDAQALTNNHIKTELVHFDGATEAWKKLAQKELKKMYEDFNLRSVQVAQKPSWKEIYRWAKTTHKAISEAQSHIGLEDHHAGINKCLNLCFNPESLHQSKGNGKMFADEDCNTIVLTSFPKHNQITIWQHEYAHSLDNRVGMMLAREQMPPSELHSCMFLSQIEMERQLSNTGFKLSQSGNLKDTQEWMMEAVSDAVCGSSSESLKEHHQKCSKEFSKALAESLIIQCIGEENWLTLYEKSKQAVLSNPKILEFVDSIAEKIYKNGVKNFYSTFWNKSENQTQFCEIMQMAKKDINADWMCQNFYKNFEKNLEAMSWGYLDIMKKYYYSHTNNQRYFSKSKTAAAASKHSLKWGSPYHTRTLEIFARSCEDLQRPLIVSTPEYFIEKEKKVIDTENFLNPTLNKNERKVFLNTLYSLAKCLGMEVKARVDDAASLKEIIINEPVTTYSSMSENEEVARGLLEKIILKIKVH